MNDKELASIANDAKERSLAPPYLYISADFNAKQFATLIKGCSFSPSEQTLIAFLERQSPGLYSLPTLAESLAMPRKTMINISGTLATKLILHTEKVRLDPSFKRQNLLYVLRAPTSQQVKGLLAKTSDSKKTSLTIHKSKIKDVALPVLPAYALIDDLICGALAPALPLVKMKNANYRSELTWRGRSFAVKTLSFHGTDVAEYDDIKTYVAILSCVEILILQGRAEATETFTLKLNDILQTKGIRAKIGETSRQSIWESISRLRNTKFEIIEEVGGFDELFASVDEMDSLREINLLSNIALFNSQGGTPTKIVEFQLPKFVVDSIRHRVRQGERLYARMSLDFYSHDPILLVLYKQLLQILSVRQHLVEIPWGQLRTLLSQPSSVEALKARFTRSVEKFTTERIDVGSKSVPSVFEYRYLRGRYNPLTKQWGFTLKDGALSLGSEGDLLLGDGFMRR